MTINSHNGAGGVIVQGSLPRFLEEGINEEFGQSYKAWPTQWDKFLDFDESTRAYEIDVMFEGFDVATEKAQANSIDYDSAQQGFAPVYRPVVYARGYQVSDEAMSDNKYGLFSKGARLLANSIHQAEELIGIGVLNDGHTANTVMEGGDGKTLFDTAHPLGPSGGTYSNTLSSATALSQTGIEDLCIQIAEAVDTRGNPMVINPQCLIVGTANKFNVRRITESTLQSGTMNNDINTVNSGSLFPKGIHVNNYMGFKKRWYIKTDIDQGLRRFNRRPIRYGQDVSFDDEVIKYKASIRIAVGWTQAWGAFSGGAVAN